MCVFLQVASGERLSKSDEGYCFINDYFPQYDGTGKFLVQSAMLDLGIGIYDTLKKHEAVFHRNYYKKVLQYSAKF